VSDYTSIAPRRAVALLAGSLAFPLSLAHANGALDNDLAGHVAEIDALLSEPLHDDAPVLLGPSRVDPVRQIPPESCLAETICALKDKLRWRGASWSPSYCQMIAQGILSSSAKYDIPPVLLLAVMINESDLNENAVNTTMKDGAVYAKDSGLMGIRCILDAQGKCTNGPVRGMTWKALMDPLKNIEVGARELARWRDGGGIMKVESRVRHQGQVVTKTKIVPCNHATHAYWAHYNHGPRYIDKGTPRHYPHRVAVLYHSLAKALNVDAPELRTLRITMIDKGQKPRTPDRPVEKRYKEICERIQRVGGLCSPVASALPN
jgi:hypothetical protein